MKLTTTLLFSIATLSAANPLPPNPATNSSLVARAPIVSVKCGAVKNAAEVTYSIGNIDQAYTTGSALLLPPVHKAKGTNNKFYPDYFGNGERIPLPDDCNYQLRTNIVDLQEFPILRGKVPFGDGSNPGPDRVIFARLNKGDEFVYCFTVYHTDNNGRFAQCT